MNSLKGDKAKKILLSITFILSTFVIQSYAESP